ncbi:MAG: hypothetical protein K5634_05865 [Sphaerochaetaceae bacterium]|nr:hypothetical protein [Sphaerochaetaceae bacterium]
MAEIDGDSLEFIKELEKKFGGPVDKRTFSLWYGDSEGNLREFGVFLYRINGIYHYEDYKREPRILGFKVPQSNPEKYVKFERSFDPEGIASVTEVRKKYARAFCKGETGSVKAAGLFARLFLDTVHKIEFKDGTVKFFQLIEKDFFDEYLKKH